MQRGRAEAALRHAACVAPRRDWTILPENSAMRPLTETIEASVAAWSGIAPPNDPARRLAADLAATVAAFEALRGTLRFEDEPASFTAALQAAKE